MWLLQSLYQKLEKKENINRWLGIIHLDLSTVTLFLIVSLLNPPSREGEFKDRKRKVAVYQLLLIEWVFQSILDLRRIPTQGCKSKSRVCSVFQHNSFWRLLYTGRTMYTGIFIYCFSTQFYEREISFEVSSKAKNKLMKFCRWTMMFLNLFSFEIDVMSNVLSI